MPGIDNSEIVMYDMASFCVPNAGAADRHGSGLAQITADAYLSPQPGGQAPIETAEDIFSRFADEIAHSSGAKARREFGHSVLRRIQGLPDFTVLTSRGQSSPYLTTLYEEVLTPFDRPSSRRRGGGGSVTVTANSFNGNQAALLSAAMKLAGKLPHQLTRGDIMRASHIEGDMMANSISQVFAAYKVDQFLWAHRTIEGENVPFNELITEYRADNPPPWETLRVVLSDMQDATGDDGLFNFDFSDPDDYDIRVENYDAFTFKAQMTNRTTGARYEPDSLSSGEKILMALCLVSFNRYLGRRPPKLLLLDELDSVLHPSMILALIRTLKNLFVDRGTKVLMTSHSPMTVAALEETDIFRVVRTGGDVGLHRTTKSEAISELSEGLATVDMGLRIAAHDEAKVTILTEGHNTKHLKRWVELNFTENVIVFEGLEEHSNDDRLLAYGRLLARMKTNTHFVLVWDCDAAGKAEALRRELSGDSKVTPYAFPKRTDNTIAGRGIENNYDEMFLEPYATTTTAGDGTILGRGFQGSRKSEFAKHVRQHGTPQYFTNFEDLRGVVSGILATSCNAM